MIFSLCFFCAACDSYAGQRPYAYNNTKWSCEEYNAWFIVADRQLYGKAIVDGNEEEIYIRMDPWIELEIHSKDRIQSAQGNEDSLTDESVLWRGKATYGPEQLTLYDAALSKGIFGEPENNAVFIREDLTEEEVHKIMEDFGK